MNYLLKWVLIICVVVFVFACNNILFDWLFQPSYDYTKNIAWSVLFSFFMTALIIAVFRLVAGKMKIKISVMDEGHQNE